MKILKNINDLVASNVDHDVLLKLKVDVFKQLREFFEPYFLFSYSMLVPFLKISYAYKNVLKLRA